jgi:hypothetical protein
MDIASAVLPETRRPFHLSPAGRELAVHGEITRPDQLAVPIAALRVERALLEVGG